MARYIDADWIYEKVENRYRISSGIEHRCERDLLDLICEAPTADVVPKIEVERLQEELSEANADVKNYMKIAEYQQSLSVKRYHEIKQLKEDVDRLQDINNRQVENVRLTKQEVAREIFAEIEQQLRGLFDFFRQDDGIRESGAIMLAISEIAELKKKYTE